MTAPLNPPPEGGRASRRRPLATALLWVVTVGAYWPVWLWRTYRALCQTGAAATSLSPRRAAALAAIPGLNLLWTAFLSMDLPRAVRRARSREAGSEAPDTELLTILLVTPVGAGVVLAIALGFSPLLVVVLAGYLAWPFELPAAIATERALGDLQPAWKTHERRRDVVGGVAAGVAAVCAIVIVLTTSGDEKTRPVPRPEPRTFSDVSDIAVTENALWITNTVQGTLLKLDPRTREPLVAPIRVGRQPIDVGARADGVWVANYESGTVVRVDPATNQLTGPVETGRGPFGIAVTPAAVWVTNQVERTVVRVDPRTNKRTGRPVLVGRGPRGVAVGEGAVWVATGEGNGVSRVDPSSRARRAHQIRLGRFCHDVAVAGGYVWVTNPNESTVMRIDPDTNRRAGAPITIPGGPSTIEPGFGSLWVAGEAGTVTRINPRTGRPSGRSIELGAQISDLAIGDDAVWVLRGDGKVRRLSPRR